MRSGVVSPEVHHHVHSVQPALGRNGLNPGQHDFGNPSLFHLVQRPVHGLCPRDFFGFHPCCRDPGLSWFHLQLGSFDGRFDLLQTLSKAFPTTLRVLAGIEECPAGQRSPSVPTFELHLREDELGSRKSFPGFLCRVAVPKRETSEEARPWRLHLRVRVLRGALQQLLRPLPDLGEPGRPRRRILHFQTGGYAQVGKPSALSGPEPPWSPRFQVQEDVGRNSLYVGRNGTQVASSSQTMVVPRLPAHPWSPAFFPVGVEPSQRRDEASEYRVREFWTKGSSRVGRSPTAPGSVKHQGPLGLPLPGSLRWTPSGAGIREIWRKSAGTRRMGVANNPGEELMTAKKGKPHGLDRRAFLRAGVLGAAGIVLPRATLADSFGWTPSRVPQEPIRIRGRVSAGDRGIGGVAISDGYEVVGTTRDGTFELVSAADRDFLRMSLPSGFEVPRNGSGTARTYQRMTSNANGEMDARFELKPLEGSDENHVALLLADCQTQDAQEMQWFHQQTVPDVLETLNNLGNPEAIGIADGDIMYDNLALYPEFERGVQRMGIPFFQVVGNHDLDQESGTDEGSTDTFTRHFGPRYYSFNRGSVHYVVLDDVFWHGTGYMGYVGSDQLHWLENDLGGRHGRLGQEHPSPTISVSNRRMLYRLLEPYQAHILTGHTHENEHVFEGGTHEQVIGAVCGGWWTGPICGDGTPNGYAVYEARGEEITWRYKSTGHGFDHQLRVYPRGADPTAPDEIVANVWDWDPDWTVVWYENGDRRGEMARRGGTDPWSEMLHRGDDLPPRRTWVDPYTIEHLFYAPISEDAREIRVEATDRFGRVYSAMLE